MRALALAFVLGLATIAGCTVERPRDLLERLWTCESDADCLDGWGCADRSVLGEDFCRPACDPADPRSCDGYCTATGECLARCELLGDGASACPDGHACVRTNLLSSRGVCFPTETCSRSDECPQGSRCFNDVFGLPAILPGIEYASDQLYCVAVPDETDRCPSGYLVASGQGGLTCLPRCDSEGSRCPPALTCLREVGYLFAQPGASACYPGYWTLPCTDDAQCVVGRCLPIGEGRRACTYGCGEADRVFGSPGGGCAALEEAGRGLRLDALEVRCEEAEGADVCVPLGGHGAPCNDEMRCAAGLDCRAFLSGTSLVRFCSRDCVEDRECGLTAYCARLAGESGSCAPRSFEGGPCARAEQCRVGLICREETCAAP